jgi:hypothetical protein
MPYAIAMDPKKWATRAVMSAIRNRSHRHPTLNHPNDEDLSLGIHDSVKTKMRQRWDIRDPSTH